MFIAYVMVANAISQDKSSAVLAFLLHSQSSLCYTQFITSGNLKLQSINFAQNSSHTTMLNTGSQNDKQNLLISICGLFHLGAM